MHNVTQYVSAGIHNGAISPQTVIDRFEDKHKAKSIELSIDEGKIYQEAKKARLRDTIVSLLMIFPAFYIIYLFIEFFQFMEFFDIDIAFNYLLGAAFPPLLFITIVIFIKQLIINSHIRNIAKNNSEQNTKEEKQNVIISGGYSPFTGYGFDLDSWSFTVNVKRAAALGNINPKEVDVKELLESISQRVSANIGSAQINDQIFVNGKDIRNNKMFLESVTSKPVVNVPEEVVNDYIGRTDEDVRHYRVLSIPMWKGQMHLTIFLRFTIVGDQLFAESRFFLLLPLKEDLMVLDKVFSKSGFSYYYGLIFLSFFKSLYTWVSGPILLLTWLNKIQKVIVGDPENKLKRKDNTYNYGNTNSLRESWSTLSYHRYFQMLDKDLNYKVTQHIIINSIIDYLESKGISTEDIKERQTTIMNSGVMVTGGTVKAEQMAVGTGASLKNRVANAIPTKK